MQSVTQNVSFVVTLFIMTKHFIMINGSPRKNGNVAHLLNLISDELTRGGAKVTEFSISDMNVSPCRGCMKCRSTEVCILPHDNAHDFAAALLSADGIVIGTPVYWGNINGQLKLLFDRIVPSLMGESPRGIPLPVHKGKRAAIAVTCTTPPLFDFFAGESKGAVRALKEILGYSGFHVLHPVVFAGTKKAHAVPNHVRCQAVRTARALLR